MTVQENDPEDVVPLIATVEMPKPKLKQTQYERTNCCSRLFRFLYGELPYEDKLRAAWLSATLFFIIGGYWLLRSLKDSVLAALVGLEYQPTAKMISLIVVLTMVFIYNRLVDLVQRHKLFYILGLFYGLVFAMIAFCLSLPVIGLGNEKKSPYRVLGWVSYFAIESYGSICVSLFWSFVNSTFSYGQAKSTYGLIIAGAQVGSILGPTFVSNIKYFGGIGTLYFMGAASPICMAFMISMYVRKFGVDDNNKSSTLKDKGAGLLEGVKLLMKYPYVSGIFAISCLFEIVITILDYELKVLGKEKYPSTNEFASFIGKFGQAVNLVSFTLSLVGTSCIIRKCGLRWTLMAFPVLILVAVISVFFYPVLPVIFVAMIFLKALSYALNNPSKEMLYSTTSDSVKYKSKSWIDVFGGRLSKATGSSITNSLKSSTVLLLRYGSVVSLAVSGILLVVASLMGKKFESLQESGIKVGEAIEIGNLQSKELDIIVEVDDESDDDISDHK